MISIHPTQLLEEEIKNLSDLMAKEKKMLNSAVDLFANSEVYTVKDNGGTVEKYKYFIYPFKGLTLVNHRLHAHLGKYLAKLVRPDTEVILTIESDGIAIASYIGAELDIPVIICKSFHYNVPMVEFVQQTGYYNRPMYLPKIIQGKKVAIIDCLISTGGTIKAMIDAIKSLPETEITGVYCVNNKSNYGERKDTFENYEYKYLFETYITDDSKVNATPSKALKTIFWKNIDKNFYGLTEQCAGFSNISKNGLQVGALIVDSYNFEILAWGYRRGSMHAEADAISMLKSNCPDWQKRDMTLYCTLEPCSHRHQTDYPTCSDLILQIPQIRWVVIGEIDNSDEKINGSGINKLSKFKHLRIINPDQTIKADSSIPHFSNDYF